MGKQFTLAKTERLKSRKLMDELFRSGKKFSLPPFRITYTYLPAANPGVQLGAGVSSKVFKKAPDRNRIKRLIREAWRLQKKELLLQVRQQKKQLPVFIIYAGNEIPEYTQVLSAVGKIIQKITTIVNTEK